MAISAEVLILSESRSIPVDSSSKVPEHSCADTPSTVVSSPNNVSSPSSNTTIFPSLPVELDLLQTVISTLQDDDVESNTCREHIRSENYKILKVDVAVLGNGPEALMTALAIHGRTGLSVHCFGSGSFNDKYGYVVLTPRVLDSINCINSNLYWHIMSISINCTDNTKISADDLNCLRSIKYCDLVKLLMKHITHAGEGIVVYPHMRLLGTEVFERKRGINMDNEDGILLQFEDGSKVLAELAVAADGLSSVVRRVVDCCDSPIEAESRVHYSGITPVPSDCTAISGVWASKCSNNIYCFRVSDDPHIAIWEISEIQSKDNVLADPDLIRNQLVELLRYAEDALSAEHSTFIKNLQLLVDGTNIDLISVDFSKNEFTQNSEWTYYDNQLVLLGDAAHPLIRCFSNGFDFAVEDAVQLACCLSDYDDDRRKAVERFTEIKSDSSAQLFKLNATISELCFSGTSKQEQCIKADESKPFAKWVAPYCVSATYIPVRETFRKKWPRALLEQTENETEYT